MVALSFILRAAIVVTKSLLLHYTIKPLSLKHLQHQRVSLVYKKKRQKCSTSLSASLFANKKFVPRNVKAKDRQTRRCFWYVSLNSVLHRNQAVKLFPMQMIWLVVPISVTSNTFTSNNLMVWLFMAYNFYGNGW